MARTEAAKRNVAQFVNELATRIVRLKTTATAAASQVAPAQAPTVAIPQAVMMRPTTTPTELPPVTLESSSGEGIAFGNYHALIIGNDHYRNGIVKVDTPKSML
jgi:hypothetical protein